MNIDEIIQRFSGLSNEQKALVLARLAHDLTIQARGTYPGMTDEADDETSARTARAINELLHRVTAAIVERLLGETEGFPDDVLVRMGIDPQYNPVAQSCGPGFVRILAEIGAMK